MFRVLLTVTSSMVFMISSVHAETPSAKGLKIAQAADVANTGFAAETSEMKMTLINAHGDKTERRMSSKVLEGTTEGDKSIITFLWPADVKDTRMLTWSHKKKNDDQWLYLPSLKRVKRISSRSKSGSFMGSEFAYEDLGSQEIEKYTYVYLRDEELKGRKTQVLQRTPTDKKSGYSKQIVWMDIEYQQATKIDFYDRKGELLKTFTFSGHTQHGKFWRADVIEANNHQTRKRSLLNWSKRQIGVSLNADAFSKDSLQDW